MALRILFFWLALFFMLAGDIKADTISDQETLTVSAYVAPNNLVNFSGKACPQCRINLLRAGQKISDENSDSNGDFQLTDEDLPAGSYLYGLYANDSEGNNSNISSYYVNISSEQGTLLLLSDILLSPIFYANKVSLTVGEVIIFSGKTAPNAQVEIELNNGDIEIINITADSDGFFYYQFNTAGLSVGSHSARSKVFVEELVSPFSRIVEFEVEDEAEEEAEEDEAEEEAEEAEAEEEAEEAEEVGVCKHADINNSGEVNLTDLSILFFWYEKNNPPNKVDMNSDDKIDLVDFSILIYCWS